jgi:hypothetical protein
MNLLKPGPGCNISVTQSLDFTENNNILFTVTMNGTELVKGNVVAVAKWMCDAATDVEIKVPSKFVISFVKMALESVS